MRSHGWYPQTEWCTQPLRLGCRQVPYMYVCVHAYLSIHVRGARARASMAATHQLNEECRLSHRLGCCVREDRDRAAFPLLWWGKTAGEKALFIRTALWGHTHCSLSNTWRSEVRKTTGQTRLRSPPVCLPTPGVQTGVQRAHKYNLPVSARTFQKFRAAQHTTVFWLTRPLMKNFQ